MNPALIGPLPTEVEIKEIANRHLWGAVLRPRDWKTVSESNTDHEPRVSRSHSPQPGERLSVEELGRFL